MKIWALFFAWLWFCVFAIGCEQPLLIGHRRNTVHAVERTLNGGVDGIELDVQRCKTGEVVVVHPQDSDALFENVPVAEKTFAELQRVELEDREKIPTLEAVLDSVGKNRISRNARVFIELKDKKHAVGALAA
jgi:glycerophosphoryl diester phosphodiesterase